MGVSINDFITPSNTLGAGSIMVSYVGNSPLYNEASTLYRMVVVGLIK